MIFGIRLRARLSFLLILLVLGGCFQSTPKHDILTSTQYLPQDSKSSKTATLHLDPTTETAHKTSNLWDYFRHPENIASLITANVNQKKIDSELQRIADNQHYFNLISDNARPYLKYIIGELEEREMPLFLALVPAIESSYRSDATSSWKAAGLWQFIPSTGKHFGLKQNWWYDGRRDVVASTEAALNFLQELHDQFGDWSLALAAYNSGGGTVSRAIRKNEKLGKPTDYWSLTLPPETRQYIPKLIALNTVISAPEDYGISIPEILDETFITEVDVKGQIQLARAAELANMELDDLKRLNAGHTRWATDPAGPHMLLVPSETAERLAYGISRLSESERVTWRHHTIKSGESLSTIAEKYRISVSVLQTTNKLSSSLIKTGKHLLVPDTSTGTSTPTIETTTEQTASTKTPVLEDNNYLIKSGDSLWLIARRYNIHVQQILDWNNIDRNHSIIPGKKLKLLIQAPQLETAAL